MKRLRIILLLTCTLLPLIAEAGTSYATVGSVHYYIELNAKTAEVTKPQNNTKYSGHVTIPSKITVNGVSYTVTGIGYRAFYQCTGLTGVTIPNSVTYIGDTAFGECTSLKSVTLPNSITEIWRVAFWKSGLESIVIPNSVKTIYDSAFSLCSNLKNVTVGTSVESFGSSVFASCDNLISITVHSKKIGEYWFNEHKSIKTVVIGDEVETIEKNAFKNCSGMTSLTLGKSITTIGDYAFRYCVGLSTVNIPNSVTRVGRGLFDGCSNLKNVTIGGSLTNLSEYMFSGCISLADITIPNTVTYISSYAFNGCTGLTNITIPNSVTSIRTSPFLGCNGLTSMTIHCAYVGLWFNSIPSLKEVVLGKEVTSIDGNAFGGCKAIETITAYMKNPPTTSSSFGNVYSTATLYVPFTKKLVYLSKTNWDKFQNIVKMPPEPGDVLDMTISHSELELYEKRTFQLTSTILPQDAIDKSVMWKSSNSKVVSVDENGKLTTYKPGTATITCKSNDNWEVVMTCSVTVNAIPVSLLTINKSSMSLLLGEREKLTASILPTDASNKNVSWTSADSSIATVSTDGTVTGIKVGKTTVTCTAADNDAIKAVCEVTVKPIEVTSLKLNMTSLSMIVGSSNTLTPTILPSNATYKDVTWQSSNPEVASVSKDGIVKALTQGTTVITCSSVVNPTMKASCDVTVSTIPVTQIAFREPHITTHEQGSISLSYTITPSNATNKSVTWELDDSAVVEYINVGLIRGKRPGTANVTVRSVSNPDVFATCKVTIIPYIINFFMIPQTLGVQEGAMTNSDDVTLVLEPTVDKRVSWKTGDSRIATVDANGLVTGKKAGTTTLICTSLADPTRTCNINVEVMAANLRISRTYLPMYEGDSDTITHFIYPEDRVTQKVTWSSSDPEVVTVDSNGVVHALKAGTATLTCVWTFNPERMEKCLVKVTKPYVPPVPEPLPTKVYTEYSIDSDPGFGKGQPVIGTQWGSREYELDLSCIMAGAHLLYIRCQDEYGRWSPTIIRPLYVCRELNIVALEYYFYSENLEQKHVVMVPASAQQGDLINFDIMVEGLAEGHYQLYVRGIDAEGKMTEISSEPLTVVANVMGVKEVKLDFAFNIGLSSSRCVITPCNDANRNDCLVEIYDIAGRNLAKTLWRSSSSQLSLPVCVRHGTVLIVKIQDKKNGRLLTRRVVME